MWAFLITLRPSSVRPSSVRPQLQKNLLLWNRSANFDKTLVECSLDGPLPKLCPMTPPSNQDGRQAKNRKKGGWNFKNLLLWNYKANPSQTLLKWSLGGPFPKLCPTTPTSDQYGRQAKNRKKGGWISKIFSSETIVQILTKLYWNGVWVVFFQNCVRHFRRLTKMAATAELSLTLNPMGNSFNLFLFWSACSIYTKLWWNGH